LPASGDINSVFGVYRTLCCGAEIVIPEGVIFPGCPNHPSLLTTWRTLADDSIPHASEPPFIGTQNGSAA
jgi:hypothetical protein